MSKPAPKCTLPDCNHYASHGPRCGHVDCPCRNVVTAKAIGVELVGATFYKKPTVRTDREYD